MAPTNPPSAENRQYLDPANGRTGPDGSQAPNPEYAFLPNVVVPLVEPIMLGTARVSEITIRRPKVKDNAALAAMRCSDEERGRRFMALLTGLSPDEFGELDAADIALLGEWLELFTSARRKL